MDVRAPLDRCLCIAFTKIALKYKNSKKTVQQKKRNILLETIQGGGKEAISAEKHKFSFNTLAT